MSALPGYQLEENLHDSSRSVVYRAKRLSDKLPVVLKFAREESSSSYSRLEREYEILNDLSIGGVVRTLGLESDGKRKVLVLEDFGGVPLSSLLGDGPLELKKFLESAIELAEALAALHRRDIIHKDINPSNVLVGRQTGRLKLIDFDISSRTPKQTRWQVEAGVLEGSLRYISPEQTGRMNVNLDYRTDLYSLGAVFFEMLCGRPPFESKDPLELIHHHIAHRPPEVRELNPEVPPVLSKMVMQLLEKWAENRYQSAQGVVDDLRKFQTLLTKEEAVKDFRLSLSQSSDQFRLPHKLYGREAELVELAGAFEAVCSGERVITIVAGYSGIGKSALVREINRPIVGKRGYFVVGKFDQLNRNFPYAGIVFAFQDLIRQLLTESESILEDLRARILAALGPGGQVLIDVIPQLELIIGKQPLPPELAPGEARNRFQLHFRSFVGALANRERPIALFLDDLQWADSSSLELLEILAEDQSLRFIHIIGSYRDNEIDPAHQLFRSLDEIVESGVRLSRIHLKPLGVELVNRLLVDTLGVRPERSFELANLCTLKTGGNPFFLEQFLQGLHERGLLRFDEEAKTWVWDIKEIESLELTDNVVEFLVEIIESLPPAGLKALKLASCIGNRFELGLLALLLDKNPNGAREDLWSCLKEELLVALEDNTYSFLHDRVQQAAHSLLSEEEKSATHLLIGRRLLKSISLEKREEYLFEIVNHLNAGRLLLDDPCEELELLKLNILAAEKSIHTTGFAAAYTFAEHGLALLPPDWRDSLYEPGLRLRLLAAQSALLLPDFEAMEEHVTAGLSIAQTLKEKIIFYEQLILGLVARNRLIETVNLGLEVLDLLGVRFPKNPGSRHLPGALLGVKLALLGKSPETLLKLPLTNDWRVIASLRILTSIMPAAYFSSTDLFPLLAFKMAYLAVKKGTSLYSVFAFGGYAVILVGALGDIERGYEFGRLSMELLKRLDNRDGQARGIMVYYTLVRPWKKSLRGSLKPLLDGYKIGLENGEQDFATLNLLSYFYLSFYAGVKLGKLNDDLNNYRGILFQLKQQTFRQVIEIYHQTVLNFCGKNSDPILLKGSVYDEDKMYALHQAANDQTALFTYNVLKAVLHYHFGDSQDALAHLDEASAGVEAVVASQVLVYYNFYDSLVRLRVASALGHRGNKQGKKLFKESARGYKNLKKWARHIPANYRHKQLLLEAEYERLEGNYFSAAEKYDRAIELAAGQKFFQEEGLACELAGEFYIRQNRNIQAEFYLRQAVRAYETWGGLMKVRRLKEQYPRFLSEYSHFRLNPRPVSISPDLNNSLSTSRSISLNDELSTSRNDSSRLDLLSVIKTSRFLAGQIELGALLKEMIRIMMENAGADEGIIILNEEGRLYIQARSETLSAKIRVLEGIPLEEYPAPLSVIQYARRTASEVLLHDAVSEGDFTFDPHIVQRRVKSLLCIPIIHQRKFIGFLYLENKLTAGAFTQARLEVLKLLCSQVAIFLENSRLYEKQRSNNLDLERQNEKLDNLQRDLKRSLKAKDEFMSNMSHELRTPLAVIYAYGEMLQDVEDYEFEEIRTFSQEIFNESKTLLGYINDLILLTELETADTIEREDLNLNNLVGEVLTEFAPLIEEKEARMEIKLTGKLNFQGTHRLISVALKHLLKNSLVYNHKGGVVEVRARALDGWINLRIKDSGIGMAEKELSYIWQRFYRVDQSSTYEVSGLGQGLYLTRRIVELHGGDISVESNPGKGSCFELNLPLQTPVVLDFTRNGPK